MTSLIYTVISIALQLQSVSTSQGPPPPTRGDDPESGQLPIDGNIWVLLVIGVLFGIYIIYKRHQAINRAA